MKINYRKDFEKTFLNTFKSLNFDHESLIAIYYSLLLIIYLFIKAFEYKRAFTPNIFKLSRNFKLLKIKITG